MNNLLPNSSYHNTLINWIKSNMLISYEITRESHKNSYDKKSKTYKGPKENIKVLRLHFINNKSFFVREQYIDEYIKIINNSKSKIELTTL